MSRLVVVSRDDGERNASLVVGPFEAREAADEFAGLLARTTKATSETVVVLALHTPERGEVGPDAG